MTRGVSVSAVALLAACFIPSVSFSFTPHSRVLDVTPIASVAMQVYEGDLPYLEQAGAVLVGTLYADGNEAASRKYLANKTARQAARRGGTHFFVGARNYTTRKAALTPASCNTSGSATGSTFSATTTCQPPVTVDLERESTASLVFRVTAGQMVRLPPPLRFAVRANAAPEPAPHERPKDVATKPVQVAPLPPPEPLPGPSIVRDYPEDSASNPAR